MAFSLCADKGQHPIKPALTPAETHALRTFLEQLFPGCNLSEAGIALLGAEMVNLENESEAMIMAGLPVDYRFENRESGYEAAWTVSKPVFD